MFAIRNVRRSGSVTPSISLASCAFTLGRAKCFESPFQSETLPGFASSKIFPDMTPLRDEGRFFAQGELGRVAPFHEARKHRFEQRRGRSQAFGKSVLDEAGERIVKTVRQGQRRASFAVGGAGAFADMLEKLLRGPRRGRLRVGAGHKFSAVIVRPAGENLLPRLGVGGLKIVPIRELLDFLRCQSGKKVPRQDAQERIAQTVDAFEVLEKEDQPFEVRDFELAVDAIKRVGDGVGDRFFLKVALQVVDVLSQGDNFGMLSLGNSPNQNDEFCTDHEENT